MMLWSTWSLAGCLNVVGLLALSYAALYVMITRLKLHQPGRQKSQSSSASDMASRKQEYYKQQLAHASYSIQAITRNLYYLVSTTKDVQTHKSSRLVLLYCFMTAKPRHIRKYACLYTGLGMDVLAIRITTMQALSPVSGSQVIAEDICSFLRTHLHDYQKLFVAGCSVGAYLYTETVIKIRQDEKLHNECLKKLVGQIWECGVTVSHLPIGVAASVADNPLLRRLLTYSIQLFLRIRHETVTRHFLKAEEVFFQCPMIAPTYYMYSTTDPMSTEECTEAIADQWKANGVKAIKKVFENVPHAQNFAYYPREYRDGIHSFLVLMEMTHDGDVERLHQQQPIKK